MNHRIEGDFIAPERRVAVHDTGSKPFRRGSNLRAVRAHPHGVNPPGTASRLDDVRQQRFAPQQPQVLPGESPSNPLAPERLRACASEREYTRRLVACQKPSSDRERAGSAVGDRAFPTCAGDEARAIWAWRLPTRSNASDDCRSAMTPS